jgi:hypothetical protein
MTIKTGSFENGLNLRINLQARLDSKRLIGSGIRSRRSDKLRNQEQAGPDHK